MIGYVDGLPFRKVPLDRPRVGWGPNLITYEVFVEKGTVKEPRRFASRVYDILADERGWIRGGKTSFQQVADGGNTQLILAQGDTVDTLCYPLKTEGEVSCCQGMKVVLNVARWKNAVPHWTKSLAAYRTYLVNHEFGHRQFHPHGYCPGPGQKAPLMSQQTYSLQGCTANEWPLDSEL